MAAKQYYLSALHLAHNHLDIHILWYDSPQRPVGKRARRVNIKHSRGALHWPLMAKSGNVTGGRLVLDICGWTVIYNGKNSVQVCAHAFKNVISVWPTPLWAFSMWPAGADEQHDITGSNLCTEANRDMDSTAVSASVQRSIYIYADSELGVLGSWHQRLQWDRCHPERLGDKGYFWPWCLFLPPAHKSAKRTLRRQQ